MKLQNNITGNAYSDEWYTDQQTVDLAWSLLAPKVGSTIMFPFDSDKSLFVKKGLELGHKVIYGIRDFIGSSHYEFDYLITNPPFSLKNQVIETVYKYEKPSALLLPMDSIGGVKRHSIYAGNPPGIYVPTRRVNYYNENWVKCNGANFHSIIMFINHEERKGLHWEFENAATT